MELLERYLAAIRRNLPAAKADDIVAELRDDLVTRQEDREESLGRPLTKDETSALLKEFGHPLVVASRFRTHQYLIGPALFPFYLSVMRIVLMIVVAIVIAVSIGKAVFGGGDDLIQAWAQAMSGIFSAVLINAALVTAAFAVLERTGLSAAPLVDWVPDHLPDVLDKRKGQWESAIEVALGIVFLLWWAGLIHLPIPAGSAEFRLLPGPVWTQMYWPILILVSARLFENLVQWLRPRWKAVRAVLAVATTAGGVALLATIYRAGDWARVVPGTMTSGQAQQLQESLDLGLGIAILVVAAIWVLQCMGELWGFARHRAGRAG